MNDPSIITNLISSVGFPIVVCLIMIYNNMTTSKELTEAVNSLKNVIMQLSAQINDSITDPEEVRKLG